MNLKSGYPFWLIKDGLPYNYPKLEKTIKTNILIIGGGITGALLNYYFTKNNLETTVIDARTIGLGSSCASTALLQYEIDVPLHKLVDLVGADNAIQAYKLCGNAINELVDIAKEIKFDEISYQKSLYYSLKNNEKADVLAEFEIRKANGFDVELLEKDAIKQIYGIDSPSAILSKLGAQTNPYAFAHALHQHAIKNGSNVYDRTCAETITHNDNHSIIKLENGQTIIANKIVYATGFESVKYINQKVVNLLSTYAIISEQLNPKHFWKDQCLIWNTSTPYLYIRTTPDHRILVGGRDEKFSNANLRDELIEKKSKQLCQDFMELFPNIPFVTEFSWAGTFGETKDGLPFIGTHKDVPNSYFALGFGGNGITFSQIAAEIITDALLNKKNENAKIFAFDR